MVLEYLLILEHGSARSYGARGREGRREGMGKERMDEELPWTTVPLSRATVPLFMSDRVTSRTNIAASLGDLQRFRCGYCA